MPSNKKITIIGAGWLGMPLTISLLQNKNHVIATKPSEDGVLKVQQLLSQNHNNINDFSIKQFSEEILNEQNIESELLQALFYQRQIIITVPPTPFIQKYSSDEQVKGISDYVSFIQNIAQLAERYHALEIIYMSSISVYGNSSGIIHEELPAMPKTASAKAIFNAEKSLQNRTMPITILRLAGLIGNGRHPIFSLQGRDNIRSPFNAINLLPIQDLIRAILTILAREKNAQDYNIYNLVAPTHPNRQSYYHTIAKKLALPLPAFEPAKPELKKIIDGGKITEMGDFRYQELDLLNTSLKPLFSE